eukprot:TRINITY_DN11413_c0_g1_i2.p1 TRINITY_DN11413_c0_g1~~TRINITY_DN11413_c0_g1_i2.p1  ORF type:complete len:314 (+),score=74.80 TRINITY_DN11413_c0_g1_i2:110-943(+)
MEANLLEDSESPTPLNYWEIWIWPINISTLYHKSLQVSDKKNVLPPSLNNRASCLASGHPKSLAMLALDEKDLEDVAILQSTLLSLQSTYASLQAQHEELERKFKTHSEILRFHESQSWPQSPASRLHSSLPKSKSTNSMGVFATNATKEEEGEANGSEAIATSCESEDGGDAAVVVEVLKNEKRRSCSATFRPTQQTYRNQMDSPNPVIQELTSPKKLKKSPIGSLLSRKKTSARAHTLSEEKVVEKMEKRETLNDEDWLDVISLEGTNKMNLKSR